MDRGTNNTQSNVFDEGIKIEQEWLRTNQHFSEMCIDEMNPVLGRDVRHNIRSVDESLIPSRKKFICIFF